MNSSQSPEWPLTRPLFVTLLCIAYAASLVAFLYMFHLV